MPAPRGKAKAPAKAKPKSAAKTTRRKKRTPQRRAASPRQAVPAVLVYLVFVAVGLGTWSLAQETRSLLLWGILLVGSLVLAAGRANRFKLSLGELGRGLVFGLVIGLPLAVLLPAALTATAERLYGPVRLEQLLLRLVVVAPLVEGVYFRGLLQPSAGLGLAALLYGVAGLILYLPTAAGFPAVLAAIVLITAVFGLLYGVVAERYGLAVSITCHAAAALCLWVLPPVLSVINAG